MSHELSAIKSQKSGYKMLYGTIPSFLRKQESRETEAKSGFPLKNCGNDRNRRNAFLFIIFFSMILFANYAHAVEYGLEDLYKLALEGSERIKISEEDVYIAGTGKDKAKSVLLPKLSAFWNYTKYTEQKLSSSGSVIQPEDSTYWGLRLDQSVSLSGREVTAFNMSKENIEKSRYDLHSVKEDYLLSVSSAYYEALRAKKALEIARSNVERLTKHRDASAVRVKVGEATKTTLLRAEAELSGAQSEEIRARNGLQVAMAVLARVAGIEGAYDLKEATDSSRYAADDKGAETIESLKQAAFSERAELKSLELQKKIGEGQVRYTQGLYWPTLSVEGVYSRKNEDPKSAFLNKESVYGGIKLNFAFFEGGLRRAEVREAESRQRQIRLVYEDRKKSIAIEVENAYLELITQKGIMEKFEAQALYAGDNYKAVSKQFEYGIANSLDVMDANTLLVTAERQLADSKYNYQLSALRLKKATGVLLKTAVNQIK
ncbi:MAG: TolC family protein [Nitrospirae bacterium]|nr:MAG: TolC family protein [Nitrospirota bacterium]